MSAPAMTCSSGATCRLALPARLESIRDAIRAARQFLAEQNLAEQELIGCELALVEACNNAVSYSPPHGASPEVGIELHCDADAVEMHVIDHGPGFEWLDNAVLPDDSEEHGRGLFIIQSLMHETFYLRGRRQNRLIMRMTRDAATFEALHEEQSGEGTAHSLPCRSLDAKAGPQSSGAPIKPGVDLLLDRQKAHPLPGGEGEQRIQRENRSPTQPQKLAAVEQKLALSEHVIGTMAKEICFRSEELAAIFRSTSELGRANDIEAFSDRLLSDLLRLTNADWFILRLLPKDSRKLILSNASRRDLTLPPIELTEGHAPRSAEAKAGLSRNNVIFHSQQPLCADDALALAHPASSGLVRPILMGQTLLGTLAVGRNPGQPPFSAEHVQVVHTFSEFLAIQIINTRLQQEHVDHRLTTRELDIARNIQQSLLPKFFPKLTGYGLSGFCRSARQVGGDFFNVLPLTDDRVLLVVADVMGKGVPAALFAATLHTLIRTMAEWTHRPVELLERVNRLIYDELSGVDMFITAQVILADTRRRRLVVANAGHCPLLTIGRDNTIRAISPEGMPLGILPDVTFEHAVVPLNDCTAAVLYTDGLTEARNAHGEFYGQDRLFKWLQQHQSPLQTATGLSEGLLSELKSFQGQLSLSDDQTFLILAEQMEIPSAEEEPEQEESPLLQLPTRASATSAA